MGTETIDAPLRLAAAHVAPTPARTRVLEFFAERAHLTAEQIRHLSRREGPPLALSTIYRTLDTLAAAGLVASARLQGTTRSYHLATPGDHVHLACHVCRRVTDVGTDAAHELVAGLLRAHGFRIDTEALFLTGCCVACRRSATGTP